MSTKPEAKTTDKPEDPREILAKLRNEHLEKIKELSELKDKQYKLAEQIINAQDAVFKSYQTFASTSEQYLVDVINEQGNQLKAAQSTPAGSKLPSVSEVREDNLQ